MTPMSDRIDRLKKILESEPDDAFCLYGLAMEYATAGDSEEALRLFDRAIAADRPYAFLWFFDELVGVNERVKNARINTYGVYQNLHQWSVE